MAWFLTLEFALVFLVAANLGYAMPVLRTQLYRRRLKRVRAERATGPISREEIREELCRDPVALELFMADSTPDDVQRYIYLEAERRAVMRRGKQLGDNENDLFAPPRRSGPERG